MKAFSSPGELRDFVLKLADELAIAGISEAAEHLHAAATLPCTTGSEWLGELGLAVREVQRKHTPPAQFDDALDLVMSAVHVAWPQM
ncbi:MAG TPA: hypothetical protein VG028_11670 [Terriglobia bacterium]|nr:hypothetical protein [Terriglobia bacterium]